MPPLVAGPMSKSLSAADRTLSRQRHLALFPQNPTKTAASKIAKVSEVKAWQFSQSARSSLRTLPE
jgi:hypothetical protein